MPPPLGAVPIQIRGPGIVGPHLQIRGPGVADPDIATPIDQASGQDPPLGLLMAGSWADVAGLAARWPDNGELGWLVGTSITRAEFDGALGNVGDALRVLIAGDVGDITALTANWAIY
jgi:hypothetical protein